VLLKLSDDHIVAVCSLSMQSIQAWWMCHFPLCGWMETTTISLTIRPTFKVWIN